MASRNDYAEPKSRLGKGLAALLSDMKSDVVEPAIEGRITKIPLEYVRPNRNNPRKNFDDAELDSLAESIKHKGVIQPIIVRALAETPQRYEIVAGERRWRAAQRAGLHDVPSILLAVSDTEALELALVENIQREDLNPLEEANGYHALIEEHKYTQEEVARIVGKSRSHIANTMRLLNLPDHTKSLVASGSLTAGHARALLSLPDPDKAADKIVKTGMTVRDVERHVASEKKALVMDKPKVEAAPDPDVQAMEHKLQTALGLNVRIAMSGRKGKLTIEFPSLEHLEQLCSRLTE